MINDACMRKNKDALKFVHETQIILHILIGASGLAVSELKLKKKKKLSRLYNYMFQKRRQRLLFVLKKYHAPTEIEYPKRTSNACKTYLK